MSFSASPDVVASAVSIAAEWMDSPDAFVQGAYEAVEKVGFEAGAASKGPFSRLNEFLEEHVWPYLEPSITNVRQAANEVIESLKTAGQAIRAERYSGEVVQKAIIAAGWADALSRVLPNWLEGQFSFASFTTTEWLYLALAVYMFTEKRGEQ